MQSKYDNMHKNRFFMPLFALIIMQLHVIYQVPPYQRGPFTLLSLMAHELLRRRRKED